MLATEQKPQDQHQDAHASESDVVHLVENVTGATGLGGDGSSAPAPTLEEAIPSRKDRHYRSGKPKGCYHLVKDTWRARKNRLRMSMGRSTRSCTVKPHMAAKTLFFESQQRYPGKFKDGQLRTQKRCVNKWRLKQSTFVAKEVYRRSNPETTSKAILFFGESSR